MTRGEAVAWAQAIDPCALLDRGMLEGLGADVKIGTGSHSTECDASVSADSGKPLRVDLAIAFVPNDFRTSPLGELVTLDGVEVRRIDAVDSVPADQRDQLVESSCSYDLAFDHSIAVRMRVSAPRSQDACAAGERIAKGVIATWPSHPAQETSPDTVATVLTGAQPCAVVPVLQASHDVTFDWSEQSLTSCFLTVDGSDVVVSYDYRPTDLPPGEHELVVGEEFTGMGTGEKIKVVPVIDVSTESLPIATEVMAAAARTAGR